jgi:hypothetical protein
VHGCALAVGRINRVSSLDFGGPSGVQFGDDAVGRRLTAVAELDGLRAGGVFLRSCPRLSEFGLWPCSHKVEPLGLDRCWGDSDAFVCLCSKYEDTILSGA